MIYVFLALIFQSFSLIFGKFAAIRIASYSLENIITSKFYFLSLLCLVFQAIVWQIALQKIDLNKAYFFMSGVYFVIMLSSYFIFNERVTLYNIIGATIILIGITIIQFFLGTKISIGFFYIFTNFFGVYSILN